MRSRLRFALVLLAAVTVGVGTIHLSAGAAGEKIDDNLVTVAPSTVTADSTTTTTRGLNAEEWQFVGSWWEAEHAPPPTTTTTAAPVKKAAAKAAPRQAPRSYTPAEQGDGRCGGDLPPCHVMGRESGGNIRAKNPSSSASGKWQFLDSTWQGYGGYPRAMDAPEDVQDGRARQLWGGGSGCSHWSAC